MAQGGSAAVVVGESGAGTYRVAAEIKLASQGAQRREYGVVCVMPENIYVEKGRRTAGGSGPDREGRTLRIDIARLTNAPPPHGKGETAILTFWPDEKKGAGPIKGLARRSWHDRWLGLQAVADQRKLSVWVEGLLVAEADRPAGRAGPVVIQLAQGDRLIRSPCLRRNPLFLRWTSVPPVMAQRPLSRSWSRYTACRSGLPADAQGCLSLKRAQSIGWEQDLPWSHECPVPAAIYDPRIPLLQVPVEDYLRAHVLAIADDPGTGTAFTLRVGRVSKSGNEQSVQFDFAGQALRRQQVATAKPNTVV